MGSADEETPLLARSSSSKKEGNGARNGRSFPFRRVSSIRGGSAFPYYQSASISSAAALTDGSVSTGTASAESHNFKELVEPIEALSPLAPGGYIHVRSPETGEMIEAPPRSPSIVKSIPASVPYRRKARHRSFALWWINQFRHWWKSSRLLVRLAGLDALARMEWDASMVLVQPKNRHKYGKIFYRTMKHLGQGGPMRGFLKRCQPFTRSIRIFVAGWRWIEATKSRRWEVGVEEAMAFMGNRLARMIARLVVDQGTRLAIWPMLKAIFRHHRFESLWRPAVFIVFLGICRAIAPFASSFQGSGFGRMLTRNFFNNAKNRWNPIQRVNDLNLESDDCVERDEVDENADLAKLAKKIAKALGKSMDQGGEMEQNTALFEEGFRQIGAGSGGYAVYECHRRVSKNDESEKLTLLLHVTPFGPSICESLPRYCVLEVEDSQDRRAVWSDMIDSWRFNGPSLVEGYCYQGAFFSPHHFAQLKHSYDKQLSSYDRACQALAKEWTGRKPGPPTDQPGLKKFLADGKPSRKRGNNKREFTTLQRRITSLANQLKDMMNEKMEGGNCKAPKGVILYFEGLDCSGKSSTGGLVLQALEQAGFDVDMRQHNRPPTEEQKRRPWMERFEFPDVSASDEDEEQTAEENGNGEEPRKKPCTGHRHRALVWDRGPAGDFVYGDLGSASPEEKRERYREFLEFERECHERGILFCKLMFVTNRDSIAGTLGKRLAQKMMVKDIRSWLKASRGYLDKDRPIHLDGLDEVDQHIDPSDFVAFNLYLKNLHKFVNFAINTDSPANPWIVVNTTDRFSARKNLLKAFGAQVESFGHPQQMEWIRKRNGGDLEKVDTPNLEITDMINQSPAYRRFRINTLFLAMVMLFVIGVYCQHTKFKPFHIDFFPKT